jgi:hypothetical protein
MLKLTLASLLLSLPAQAGIPFHMPDPEMTGTELARVYSRQLSLRDEDPEITALQPVLATGKRNLDWLAFVNSQRPSSQQILFTSPQTQTGIPIDAPKSYSAETVLRDYAAFREALPDALRAVLFEGQPFTAELPVSDEEFARLGRKLDSIYGTAQRWILLKPYLDELAEVRRMDVRGYYWLLKEPELKQKLVNWPQLPAEEQARLRPWLVNICENSVGLGAYCPDALDRAVAEARVWDYFTLAWSGADAMWRQYFELSVSRKDVTWTLQQPAEMHVPFLSTGVAEVQAFLKDNIEDEFRWGGWNLRLDFLDSSPVEIPHVVFTPGALPHVNELAGNEIVMDANLPMHEWSPRWTIRHEFGHILGLNDCYVEFYDPAVKLITNYQLDTSNLMCSRKGKFLATHFEELKRVYLAN